MNEYRVLVVGHGIPDIAFNRCVVLRLIEGWQGANPSAEKFPAQTCETSPTQGARLHQ